MVRRLSDGYPVHLASFGIIWPPLHMQFAHDNPVFHDRFVGEFEPHKGCVLHCGLLLTPAPMVGAKL